MFSGKPDQSLYINNSFITNFPEKYLKIVVELNFQNPSFEGNQFIF